MITKGNLLRLDSTKPRLSTLLDPHKKHLARPRVMAYYQSQPQQPYGNAQNLQFYPSSYAAQPVSGTSTPFQAFNGGAQAGFGTGFGGQPGVSGRMGEQGGLRTGWLAAFGTEGYEGEPPLLEELGVNFGHIKMKVGCIATTEDHLRRQWLTLPSCRLLLSSILWRG